MRRTLGATAIFLGWLCLPLSALSGLVAFHDMGAETRHEFLPPPTVFGFAGDILVWLIAATALLALVPAFVAVFARDPGRPLYVAGAVVAGVGVGLLPDDLGRAYGALLLPAGALFAFGGWLIAGAPPGATAWEITAVWAYLDRRRQAATAPAPRIDPDLQSELGPQSALEPQIDPGPQSALEPQIDPGPQSALEPQIDPRPQSGLEPQPEAETEAEPAPEPAPEKQAAPAEALAHTAPAAAASLPGSPEALGESGAAGICPWCSAGVSAGATTCPECHATLDAEPAIDGTPISGLTAVSPELRAYAERPPKKRKRRSLLRRALGIDSLRNDSEETHQSGTPSNESAYRLPSPEVRAEMARIDSEIAEIATLTELTPTAPEPTLDAGPGLALALAAEPAPAPEPAAAAAEPAPTADPGLGADSRPAAEPAPTAAEPAEASAEPAPASETGLAPEGHAAELPARSRRAPRPKA